MTPDRQIRVWVQRFKDRPNLVLQWHDPETGERKSKSAKTADPKKADDKRRDLEADLNAGRYQGSSRMGWEQFRELFEQEYVAGKRDNTRRNFETTLDAFEQICKQSTLQEINERTVSRFAARLRKQPGRRKGSDGMMPSTVHVRLQFLRTALTWAVGQKLMPSRPAFPKVPLPQKNPQPVPQETFERLLAKAADDPTRAYLLCGWLAGLRLTEAFLLEWSETEHAPYVDFARNRIILPAEFVKGNKDQWVPLDPELRAALERLPHRAGRVFRFTDSQGRPLTAGGVSQRVADLATRAGVRLTMKALRRGFACRYAAKVPAQVLQRLMRHANIKTTMAFYANVDQAVEDAVLGPRRNDSRNMCHEQGSPASPPNDAN